MISRVRIPWGAVALGGAAVVAIGAIVTSSRRARAAAPAPQRVALIGDSYAVGLGPELAKLFPIFKYEGHVGTNTAQWASHSSVCGTCGDWLTTFRPDLVFVSLGVNDGAAPNLANYQTIARSLRGIGSNVVWIEPPASVNTPAVRAAIATLGVRTVPATRSPLAADGLHPRSYAPWAREVTATLGAPWATS
jgi:hypothetical protein